MDEGVVETREDEVVDAIEDIIVDMVDGVEVCGDEIGLLEDIVDEDNVVDDSWLE